MMNIISLLKTLFTNGILLIAGILAIKKFPFFTTNLNPKKSKGIKFIKYGWIVYFGSKCAGPIFILIRLYSLLKLLNIVNLVGIVLSVYGGVLLYQGIKSGANDEKPDETKEAPNIKKPTFTANEDMSQRAQYAYTNFRKEYEQSANVIDEAAEAKMFAKAVQLQLLKTPASAVFCSMEEMVVLPIGEGAYSVSGYVDSQNSYGAMLRNQFNLTVFKDENGTWKNANRFISTAASINGNIISTSILWWVLGIIGSIITLAVSYAFMSSMF